MKPRFGLMRGKQFVMKDMYSFNTSLESAKQTYDEICKSYDRVFERIGIDFIKGLQIVLAIEMVVRTPLGTKQ